MLEITEFLAITNINNRTARISRKSYKVLFSRFPPNKRGKRLVTIVRINCRISVSACEFYIKEPARTLQLTLGLRSAFALIGLCHSTDKKKFILTCAATLELHRYSSEFSSQAVIYLIIIFKIGYMLYKYFYDQCR